jgi:hypothetical protein
MKAMTKNQILKTTHCQFYIWHTSIDCCNVTKKALKNSLRNGHNYSAEITETCKIKYGRNAGKSYFRCTIML